MNAGLLKGSAALGICLLLWGCSAQTPEPDGKIVREKLQGGYQTTTKVKYQELEATMTIYQPPMNCAQVVFDSPPSLQNLKMTFFTDRTKLEYEGKSFEFSAGSLPSKAAAQLVISALNAVTQDQGITVRQQDDKLVIQGELADGSFSLEADGKSGNLLTLSIPERELELEILDFHILEE